MKMSAKKSQKGDKKVSKKYSWVWTV
jgi:hypothetical protein